MKKLDLRIEKTRILLELAILELASERDISTASVAELTRRCSINRSTFYDHAESPQSLLISVLSKELEEVMVDAVKRLEKKNITLKESADQTMGEIIKHLLKRMEIYGQLERPSSVNALREVLSQQILRAIKNILDRNLVFSPSQKKEDQDLYAAFITFGTVGAIETWIRKPGKRKPQTLLKAIQNMYPDWYSKKGSKT